MSTPIAVVFTGKPIETILSQGGSASWRAVPHRVRQCEFVICTRNTRAKWSDGPESHGSAFAVGRLSGVDDAPEDENDDPSKPRYLFRFSEYALLDYKDPKFQKFWKGHHWPVHYTTLEETGIDPDTLTWIPMPNPEKPNPSIMKPIDEAEDLDDGPSHAADGHRPLTMAEAKFGLSLTFGVPVEDIAITIKG